MEIARIVARCLWEESRLLQTAATAAQVRPRRSKVGSRGLGNKQLQINGTEAAVEERVTGLHQSPKHT